MLFAMLFTILYLLVMLAIDNVYLTVISNVTPIALCISNGNLFTLFPLNVIVH